MKLLYFTHSFSEKSDNGPGFIEQIMIKVRRRYDDRIPEDTTKN